jgi:hypothetical protein
MGVKKKKTVCVDILSTFVIKEDDFDPDWLE